MPNRIPQAWYVEGSDAGRSAEEKIQAHFQEYNWFLSLAENAWRRRDAQAACSYATMAALVATHRHCGFFASPRLERMLINIGRQIPDKSNYRREANAAATPKKVLHVCTEVANIGGLANMLARMIRSDASRQHSVALTRSHRETPHHITDAVAGSGGAVHYLGQKSRCYTEQALALRELSREHDLVVLHIYSEDIVPVLAFAQSSSTPPVLYLNHADHLFWLGSSICDVVINLRESGQNLSIHRRGIDAERNVMVPTLVNTTVRKRSVEEAKLEIGLQPDDILLLSVARPIKYRTHNGVTFASTHVPVLIANPKAHLIVVGAGEPADWAPAIAETDGRISSVALVRDPSLYFEAADIYVDSYPFVSATSMMEAAGYGLPLVSRFYAPAEAEIVGIDQPGIKTTTLLASDDAHYVRLLEELMADAALRSRHGNAARSAVRDLHQIPGWTQFWEAAISKAVALPPLDGSRVFADKPDETPVFAEPDLRIHEMFGLSIPTGQWLKERLRYLPVAHRLARWNDVRRSGGFYSKRNALAHLLSDKMLAALGR